MAKRKAKETERGIENLLDDCETRPEDLMACLDNIEKFAHPYLMRLPRKELRSHCEVMLDGLLSDLDRKSVEPIAERAGQERFPLQYFMGQSPWKHEPLIDELCSQVAVELGASDGILVIDPSGFPKKGNHSVGVARQWCGRLGKQDSCQVGVFLGYKSKKGHSLVDVQLYLPRAWTGDRARRKECGIPKGLRFKTKEQLALEMIRERRAQLPHSWVTADDEFGCSVRFRKALVEMGERYVVDIPGSITIRDMWAHEPKQKSKMGRPPKRPFVRVSTWKDAVPKEKWKWIPVREGTKGPMGVWATRTRVQTRKRHGTSVQEEWIIVTKTDSKIPEYRYRLSDAGEDVSLQELVHVGKARHWIEDCFERAKGEVGLDHYEVRTWRGWHHHMTLCLITLLYLVLEQRRLNKNTPAMTVQQSAVAIAELLRNPSIDKEELAFKITRRLQRCEESRIAHWRKFKVLPPSWNIARNHHLPNVLQ